MLFFAVFDLIVLVNLPKLRISFGPVQTQVLIFLLPRLAVAGFGGVIAIWIPPLPAFMGVVAINLAASIALVWGAVIEPRQPELTEISLVANPERLDAPAIRLLHICDLHIERFGRREESLLRLVWEIAPDMIVLTGDYVSLSNVDDPIAHEHSRQVLSALSAPLGVFAVLGSPPVDRNSAPNFEGLPITLLRDEVAIVNLGGGRQMALLGLDCSHDQETDAGQLEALVIQAPAGAYRVLLYHSPDLMPVAPQFDIDLYLCGHTHGGQVRLPRYGALITSSQLGKQYEMGHYRTNDTHLYVSRGVGMEGMGAPRIRFLCPPEIVLVSFAGTPFGKIQMDE